MLHDDSSESQDSDSRSPKGSYRRWLPHLDVPGLYQFITYRLADSIPKSMLLEIEAELRTIPPGRADRERRRRLEEFLDHGHGSGILKDPRAAECVIQAWKHFDGQRYDLIAWVVMPTHVHLIVRLSAGQSLPAIVQSWKSYTGKRLKALFPATCVEGEFWFREYWDRYIRDEMHFHTSVEYVRQNPVKAGLANSPEEWPYLFVSEKSESL